MFIALDKNKNRVSIENADYNEKYFCPICGEPLYIRCREELTRKKHFAHKSIANCDTFSHDLSEWHFNWQQQFPEQYREVVIEKNGVKHRADICINGTVIEFQHSQITSEEILARNSFYLSAGYRVVWVFDIKDGDIINQKNGIIDPMKCGEHDLCWKSPKRQFIKKIPNEVAVFLEYQTEVSSPFFLGQKVGIMLLIKEIDANGIVFCKTYPKYIQRQNFLKQYGALNIKNVYSIYDIIKETKLNKQQYMEINLPSVGTSTFRGSKIDYLLEQSNNYSKPKWKHRKK